MAKSGAKVPRRSRRKNHDRHSWIWNEPRWQSRLYCSSGMISGCNVSSSAEILSLSLSRLGRKAPSEFFLNPGTQLAVVPTRNPPGANFFVTSDQLQLLFTASIECFRSIFVQLLESGSKFLSYTYIDLRHRLSFTDAESRKLFNFKIQSFRYLESKDEIP